MFLKFKQLDNDGHILFSMATGILSAFWIVYSVFFFISAAYISALAVFICIPMVWIVLLHWLVKQAQNDKQ